MTNIVKLSMLDSGIALITIDTPNSKLNVLSEDFFAEFEATIAGLESRKDLSGLIIASGKEDNFFAGADVKQIRALQSQPAHLIYEAGKHGQDVFNRVAKLPFPTVAAINGTCLGGGLELTLACKYRLASTSPKTSIGFPEVQLGFIPGWAAPSACPV